MHLGFEKEFTRKKKMTERKKKKREEKIERQGRKIAE